MKNNYFLKQKKISEKSGIAYIFVVSLLPGLIEHSWILISAPTFNLLQYVL